MLNHRGRQAIQNAIDYLKDNKYRHELAEKRSPGSQTANGESFKTLIRLHEEYIRELEENLH